MREYSVVDVVDLLLVTLVFSVRQTEDEISLASTDDGWSAVRPGVPVS